MDEEKSVNVLDSLDGDQGKSQDEGKSPQDLEKKVRENLRGEYERKSQEAIEKEKVRLQESYQSRIEELEGKTRLTQSQENELDWLKDQENKIRSDKGFKPWEKIIRDTIREEMERRDVSDFDRRHKENQPQAEKWLRDKAKESNQTIEELWADLEPIISDRWLDKLPAERVQKAYAEMMRYKEKFSTTKKSPSPENAEGEGRQMRKVSTKEAISESRKSGNFKNLIGAIAEKQTNDLSRGAGQ